LTFQHSYPLVIVRILANEQMGTEQGTDEGAHTS